MPFRVLVAVYHDMRGAVWEEGGVLPLQLHHLGRGTTDEEGQEDCRPRSAAVGVRRLTRQVEDSFHARGRQGPNGGRERVGLVGEERSPHLAQLCKGRTRCRLGVGFRAKQRLPPTTARVVPPTPWAVAQSPGPHSVESRRTAKPQC